MTQRRQHLEELAGFIRTHRSNEGHFEILYDRLVAEHQAVQASTDPAEQKYAEGLNETIEKHAALYREHKEKGISTYAEFENAVTHFEKSVTDALDAT